MARGEDATLEALYQRRVREWAARVRSDKRLTDPDSTVTCRGAICGSVLTLDVNWAGGVVAELGWRTRACTLTMASTAILVAAAIGQTPAQVARAGAVLKQLLSGTEPNFPEGWEKLAMLSPARDFPARHDSVLLPFMAMEQAVADSQRSNCGPNRSVGD